MQFIQQVTSRYSHSGLNATRRHASARSADLFTTPIPQQTPHRAMMWQYGGATEPSVVSVYLDCGNAAAVGGTQLHLHLSTLS